jgi:hypothetical protein
MPGRPHQLVGRNNQDAAFTLRLPDGGFVAVVCDGCSGSPRSEVGAIAGARMVAYAVASEAEGGRVHDDGAWTVAVTLAVRHRLLAMAEMLAPPGLHGFAVVESLLFTVVGAIASGGVLRTFSCGDGLLAVNGETLRLKPQAGNEPPYLAYGVLKNRPTSIPDDLLTIRTHHRRLVDDVATLIVGTDGAGDLADAADRFIPGTTERIGPLHQLLERPAVFENQDGLRRWLARIGRDKVVSANGAHRVEPGLLRDDTTLVLARKVAP